LYESAALVGDSYGLSCLARHYQNMAMPHDDNNDLSDDNSVYFRVLADGLTRRAALVGDQAAILYVQNKDMQLP
jgi:hypothetical protein